MDPPRGWSPDGSALVYQSRDASSIEIGDLFVVDVVTGTTRQMTDLDPAFYGTWSMHPSLSPDGRTIIFRIPTGPDDNADMWDLWSVPVARGRRSWFATRTCCS